MAFETLSQMYDNMLDPIKGWWDERQLTKVIPIDPTNGINLTSDTDGLVKAGMVGHIDRTSGKFKAGIPDTLNYMPLFCRHGQRDNDVRRIEGNISGQSSGLGFGNNGVSGGGPWKTDIGVSTLVGTGGYELGTTAYVAGTNTYLPNDLLTSPAPTVANAGRLTRAVGTANSTDGNAVVPTAHKMIVGVVTERGVATNKHGKSMLYFWTATHWHSA